MEPTDEEIKTLVLSSCGQLTFDQAKAHLRSQRGLPPEVIAEQPPAPATVPVADVPADKPARKPKSDAPPEAAQAPAPEAK